MGFNRTFYLILDAGVDIYNLYYFFNFLTFLVILVFFCFILFLVYTILDLKYYIKNITLYSSYECGFLPYSDARIKLDINFSTVAILFIIFDIETILILPYILDFLVLDAVGYFMLFLFILIFIYALIYEIKSKILIV